MNVIASFSVDFSLSDGGHKLVAVRVKTHPQRQINTKLSSSETESSLCNRPACCSVNAPLVQD